MGNDGDIESAAARYLSERDIAADERDRRADQRQTAADERDRIADERDHRADQRDAAADERDRRFEAQRQAVRAVVARLTRESQDLIGRSQALLAISTEVVHGAAAAAQRDARPHRDRRLVPEGTASESESGAMGNLDGPAAGIARAAALRMQLSTTVAALAATEDEVARIHEEIAAQRPSGTGSFRRIADEARSRALRLRELERHFRG